MIARCGPLPFAGSGRIYQDTAFSVPELAGYRIERLLGLVGHDAPDDVPIVVDLLPEGATWQRFFLDVGIAIWEDWGELIDEEEAGEVRFVDYGSRECLRGEVINNVSARSGGPRGHSYISILLASGRIIESSTRIVFTGP